MTFSTRAASRRIGRALAASPVRFSHNDPADETIFQQITTAVAAALPLGELDARDPPGRDAAALCFGVAMECMIGRHPSVGRLWAGLGYRWPCAEEALALPG